MRTSRLLSASWWRRHHEALLTVAPLLVMVIGGYPSRQTGWQWQLVLTALAWLPLTVRNRWPALVLVVVAAVDAVSIGVAGYAHPPGAVVPVSTMLALYTVSVRWPPRRAWAAAAAVGMVQFVVAAATRLDLGRDVLYLNWVVVAAGAGQLVRERRAKLAAADQRAVAAERSKEAEAQRRVIEERMRIAHDLHDVLAHHIAVVNAQAGVAQYLLETDPTAAVKALRGITTNSRAALDELRITLGLLRGEADAAEPGGRLLPAPTIEHLDGLLATFSQAGMHLSIEVRGSPRPLSTAAELALVRIIQEALTNASKHAPGSTVALELDWSGNPVRLSVSNERPTREGPLTNEGTGHGLIGMHERAAIANGSVTAGPTPEGGYRVTAAFPTLDAPADGGATIAEATSQNGEPRGEPRAP
jgi:signal transduction histidine kinase